MQPEGQKAAQVRRRVGTLGFLAPALPWAPWRMPIMLGSVRSSG